MRQDIRQERDIWSEKDNKDNQDNKDEKQGEKPTQIVKEIIRGFIGRNVTVMIRGKKSLSGKLESVSNYELLLTVNHESVLIMKHAIDYVSLVAKSS